MKKALITAILLFILPALAFGATYYVKTGGSDIADGLSDDTAWETITKVNASTTAGDTVNFRGADTFIGAIVILNNATYQSYGTGTATINGNSASVPFTAATKTGWTVQNLTVKNSISRNFNLSASSGTIANVTAQDSAQENLFFATSGTLTASDSTFSGGTNVINITGGTVNGTNIRATGGTGASHALRIINAAVINCTDCEFDSSGGNGVSGNNTAQINLSGGYFHDNLVDGLGIFTSAQASCDGCKSDDNGNAASPTSGDGYTAHDSCTLTVTNSTAKGNFKSAVAVTGASSGDLYNNSFYNNYEATTEDDYAIWIDATGTWNVKNNATANHRYEIFVSAAAVGGGVTLNSDYNCFYDSRGGTAFHYNGTAYNFADYQTASSQDAHSKNVDPLFMNAPGAVFRLSPASPCIDAGTDVGLTHDFDGIPVPRGTAPDIGAYEFTGGTCSGQASTPPCTNAMRTRAKVF